MRIEHIRDDGLRSWAQSYTLDASTKKRGLEEKREAWRHMSEGDWAAFRDVLELRPRVLASYSRSEVEVALQRRMRDLPPVMVHGVAYGHPWSLGLELAVLRDLLASPAQARPEDDPRAPSPEMGTAEFPFDEPPAQHDHEH